MNIHAQAAVDEPNRGFHPATDEPFPYLFVDGCVQIWPDADLAAAHRHGVTAYAVTAWLPHVTLDKALKDMMFWHRIVRDHPNLLLAATVDDILTARKDGRAALVLASQDGDALGTELHRLEAFHRLGLRMLIPVYNRTNHLGDGCLDRTDGGLTCFGQQVVQACNRLGIVLDGSHVGRRTTLEMIDLSAHPVVFSHSNAKALVDNPRNIDDEQIKACAARGGVIGIVCWGPLLYKSGSGRRPTIDDFVDHIDYVAQLVGSADHIGIGTDFSLGSYPIHSGSPGNRLSYKDVCSEYDRHFTTYPRSRQRFAEGFCHYGHLGDVAAKLEKRGYSREDIQRIMGENFLRVFRQVWPTETNSQFSTV